MRGLNNLSISIAKSGMNMCMWYTIQEKTTQKPFNTTWIWTLDIWNKLRSFQSMFLKHSISLCSGFTIGQSLTCELWRMLCHPTVNEKPSYAQDPKLAVGHKTGHLQTLLSRTCLAGQPVGSGLATGRLRPRPLLLCFFQPQTSGHGDCVLDFQSFHTTHRKQCCPALMWLILCMFAHTTWRSTIMNACHSLNT